MKKIMIIVLLGLYGSVMSGAETDQQKVLTEAFQALQRKIEGNPVTEQRGYNFVTDKNILNRAATHGSAEQIAYLLEHGFTPDKDEWALLEAAVSEQESLKKIDLLLEAKADPNKIIGKKGDNVLYSAIKKDRYVEVEKLLQAGADPNLLAFDKPNFFKEFWIKSPIRVAIAKADTKWLRLLLQYGANLNDLQYNPFLAQYSTLQTRIILFLCGGSPLLKKPAHPYAPGNINVSTPQEVFAEKLGQAIKAKNFLLPGMIALLEVMQKNKASENDLGDVINILRNIGSNEPQYSDALFANVEVLKTQVAAALGKKFDNTGLRH